MRRTDLMDTSEWAHREMVRRLRKLTPAERIRMVVELSQAGLEMRKAAQKRRTKGT